MGHALTCIAKLCLNADIKKRTFWQDAADDIAMALVILIEKKSSEEMQALSDLPVKDLFARMITVLEESIEKAAKKAKNDSEVRVRASRVKSGVERRKKQYKSEEVIVDSDVDLDNNLAGVESDIEEMDEGEEIPDAAAEYEELEVADAKDDETPDNQL
ncbi:hypothetical protein PT974_04693 [Cladobotryum mycophilum]|uniref:Uncharacterized protein n=1 Tax=Cladobotryum mycophilum TaxID=491253 RepID=A0ABR0SRB4_9HYPO